MISCPIHAVIILVPVVLFTANLACAAAPSPASRPVFTPDSVRNAHPTVRLTDSPATDDQVEIRRDWQDNSCKVTLVNGGLRPVRVHEVVVASVPHGLPLETPMWGEGFTMLSQTGGTIGAPIDLGGYTDRQHYRIPQPADATTVYGALTLSPPGQPHVVLAFTSCRRFIGSFRIYRDRIDAVLDLEDLTVPAGATWQLEEFMFTRGPDRDALLVDLADRIAVHHPPALISKSMRSLATSPG